MNYFAAKVVLFWSIFMIVIIYIAWRQSPLFKALKKQKAKEEEIRKQLNPNEEERILRRSW